MENSPVTYRRVEGREQQIFDQYLLPHIALRVRRGGEDILVLGAVWERLACGAAAVLLSGPDEEGSKTAELLSLYIDPQARRRGAGAGLVRLAMDCARTWGAALLRANYVSDEAEVAALDALFHALGAEPEFRLPVYEMDSRRYRDVRLVRRAFSWDYRTPDHIVPFSSLDETRRACLELDPELPLNVAPARRLNMSPELSLAYLDAGGAVAGFWLGSASATDRYAVQGVWRSSRAPVSCVQELLLAHVNLCYYRCGGDFLYYISPAVEYADRLIQAYSGGNYRRLEEHQADIALDRFDAGSPSEKNALKSKGIG